MLRKETRSGGAAAENRHAYVPHARTRFVHSLTPSFLSFLATSFPSPTGGCRWLQVVAGGRAYLEHVVDGKHLLPF